MNDDRVKVYLGIDPFFVQSMPRVISDMSVSSHSIVIVGAWTGAHQPVLP